MTVVVLPKPWSRDLAGLLDWMDRVIQYFERGDEDATPLGYVPTGGLVLWPSVTVLPPDGFLLTDGSVVSQGIYPALFGELSTQFNTGGEGAGNFRLPNYTATIGGVTVRGLVKT